MNPWRVFEEDVIEAIASALKRMRARVDIEETLEKPPDPKFGDLASTIAFFLAEELEKKPEEVAKEIYENLRISEASLIDKATYIGPYVNFHVNAERLAKLTLRTIAKEKRRYGSAKPKKIKVIVEHTSANPDSPLHVGHFRNTAIGDSVARTLEFFGYKVERQFYVNDMGGQLAILANYYQRLKDKRPKGKPDRWIGQIYVEANKEYKEKEELEPRIKELQKKYERGDRETVNLINKIVNICLKGFKQTLESLGVRIDRYVKESDFVFSGQVNKIIKKLSRTKYANEEEGSLFLNLEDFGVDKELVLTRADGTSLYTTRDIAYHIWKLSKAQLAVNVISAEQSLPQKQLKAALQILGIKDVQERIYHLAYEYVTVPGMRISSRLGQFILVDDLIEEGIKRAKKAVGEKNPRLSKKQKEKIARIVGIGAIKYNLLKVSPGKTIVFNWEDALNFEGSSAPYVQYSHARACSILRKAPRFRCRDFTLTTNEERELVLALAKFPSIVEQAAVSYSPHIIAEYANDLATIFNKFYQVCPVLKATPSVRALRLALVLSTKVVLANSLKLLGIKAPEVM